jgi:hypothetical protein
MRIKNEAENEKALQETLEIFDERFDSETPRAKKLLKLVDAIERFEEYHYPIGKRNKLQEFIAWLKWMFG